MSETHAVLEKECVACHVQKSGALSAKASDNACLECQDGPTHHAVGIGGRKELTCAECHAEHKARIHSAAVSNQTDAVCHDDLRVDPGNPETHCGCCERAVAAPPTLRPRVAGAGKIR